MSRKLAARGGTVSLRKMVLKSVVKCFTTDSTENVLDYRPVLHPKHEARRTLAIRSSVNLASYKAARLDRALYVNNSESSDTRCLVRIAKLIIARKPPYFPSHFWQ